jgi:hypothetical protein
MTDEPTAQATDTSEPAPQETDGDTLQFEIADTPGAEPTVEPTGDAPPPEKYFGKYDSMEDAERGFQEAQRAMHEKAEEAAAYRKALEAVQTPAQQPQYAGQPDRDTLNDQFRSHLESDPFNALTAHAKYVFQQEQEAVRQQQQALMGEVQKYSTDPNFQDVAADVMQRLPYEQNPNVESMFLRAKIAKMTQQQATQSTQAAAQTQRMHVESGAATSPSDVLRIEVDPDARRVQQAFRDDDARFTDDNKVAAAVKQMGLGGKNPVSIDEYREARRKAGV